MRILAIFLVVLLATSIAMTFAFIYEQRTQTVSQTIVKYWSGTYNYRRRITITNNITGWLSDWEKRVKVTIDNNDVDSPLSDFPVLVFLSNSSGRNKNDVSGVFDELQSAANRKKIAVTTSDGLTQCYVEIERWDDANEKAWLWVKVPFVNSTSDTDLYLYYDNTHADNTDFVGDKESTPAQNVWDGSFVIVQHLDEDPSGSPPQMKDSTPNNNDGASQGLMTSGNQVSGQIDGSLNFDGSNDQIDYGNDASLQISSDLTVEFWINPIALASYDFYVGKTDPDLWDDGWGFWSDNDNLMHFYTNDWSGGDTTASLSSGSWQHFVGVYNSSETNEVKIYKNGAFVSEVSVDSYSDHSGSLFLGGSGSTSYNLDGKLDEVRVSNITRNSTWIKASYESGRDDLLAYGEEDYVDNNTSDVDSSPDKGYHSNFLYQQGLDLAYDSLTEEATSFTDGYRVQRGDFLFQGTGTFIPLDYAVNVTHAFVIMPNLMWQENVTAATSGDPAMSSNNALVTAYLYNSTHIRVQRMSSSDGDLRIGWQVLECFDEEFSVQRGERSLSAFSNNTITDTISTAVDPTRTMAWHYLRTSYSGNDGRVIQFYSEVTGNTEITFTRQENQSITGYLRWVTVEWDLSKISSFSQGYVIGYGTDSTPFVDSIGTTIIESQSILIFQTHAIGDDGLDTSTTAGYILNNTHVAFYNFGSSFNRGVKWYVIDFGPSVGSREDNDHISWGSQDYANDDVLISPVEQDRTLVWLSGTCNGDGTAKPRHTQWWILNPMNSTHSNILHYERRYGGQNREIAWQVLELPYTPANYELDLEVQWTDVDYTETHEELCVKTGLTGAENIAVYVWNGGTWNTVITDLIANSWNNISVQSYLDSPTFTIRFKAGTESGDLTQDSWEIDAAFLHVWTYTTVESGYSVNTTLNTASLVTAGKMLSNGDDLRIVYWDGSAWTELDRQIIDMNTTSTQVWFETQAEISAGCSDDNYFMYYGNSAPPAPLDYWSDSMGADSPSRVYWYADNFEEHANNTDPDGWTNEGSEDYNVVVYEGNRWLKRIVRVNWENGTVASSMSNIGDAVWMVDIRYNQTGSNVWGGLAFHYANGGIGYYFLIRDQGWYWANEDWTVTDGWNTNTDIHFTLGQTGTVKVITVGSTAYCYWINPDGETPSEVFVVAKTIPLGTGKAKIVLESPSVGNPRWIDADNFVIRKCIDPEPLTVLGSEEAL